MNPVTFTDAAVTHIKKLVDANPKNIGFRLSVKETGCSGYSYVPKIIEEAITDDLSYTVQNDLKVYVDKVSMPYLNNIVVDYVIDQDQGLKQQRLVFINPNEKNRCGCGESFTIE